MEASHGSEPRFIRLADAPGAVELDTSELLVRLEAQAEETGRLRAEVESLEGKAQAERDSRRRISDMVKRERKAAAALHKRAQSAEAALASQTEEVARLEAAIAMAEQHKQMIWVQLTEAQRELAVRSRPLWRKLLRRPPRP